MSPKISFPMVVSGAAGLQAVKITGEVAGGKAALRFTSPFLEVVLTDFTLGQVEELEALVGSLACQMRTSPPSKSSESH